MSIRIEKSYYNNVLEKNNSSKDNNNDFTKFLTNTSSQKLRNKLSYKNRSQCDDAEKNVPLSNSNNKENMEPTKDIEKAKTLLKKSGLSEEKVDEIKIDDMDKLSKLLDSEDIDLSNLNVKELISFLQFLINDNSKMDGENLLGKISELVDKTISNSPVDMKNNNINELINSIKDNINSFLNDEIKGSEKNIPFINKLVNSLEDKLGNILKDSVDKCSDVPKQDLVKSIQKEILKVLNTEEKDLNINVNKEQKYSIKLNVMDGNTMSNEKHSDYEGNEQLKDNSSNVEDKILKNISGDNEKDKVSRAVNFMNHFTSINKSQNVETPSLKDLVVNKETVVQDIVKAVKYMELNNTKNLTVKINPKELGEIVINVTMESGKLKANITANNKEAFNMLNANISDINDKLQNSNIKIQNFTLNLYEDTTFFKDKEGKGQESRNSGNKKSKNNAIDAVEEIPENNVSEDVRNLNIFA